MKLDNDYFLLLVTKNLTHFDNLAIVMTDCIKKNEGINNAHVRNSNLCNSTTHFSVTQSS